jgi:sugar fermentation stimulation protein A
VPGGFAMQAPFFIFALFKVEIMLKWPELIKGTLIKRYKRFMADVKLDNGLVVTALCQNTGTMKSCSEPGRKVYLSEHNRPDRNLKYTWEMIEMPTSLVGVNTSIPNKLVKKAIQDKEIKELSIFENVRSEVKYGENSRIDILQEGKNRKTFIEVKNCTFMEDGICYFPDAVTARGLKHLKELQREVKSGHRAVMFYLIQRIDVTRFEPARHIDPAYSEELVRAYERGVEIVAYDVKINTEYITINREVPVKI